MESFDLEKIQAWMDGESQPQMLFEGRILQRCNRALRALWPEAEPGMNADRIFGSDAAALDGFEGSLVFSAEFAGAKRDLQVTPWNGYLRVSVLDSIHGVSYALEATARSISAPLSSVMAVTPKLLPLITEGNEKTLKWAAQLNHGLFTLLRTANHLKDGCGTTTVVLNQKPENIGAFLRTLTDEVAPLAAEAERELTLELPPRDYMVCIDGDKLKQALLNLISNALKFTGKQGKIQISLKAVGTKQLCIAVRDNGCGISPGRMGTIFTADRTEQIPDPRQGVGLGLSIARQIVWAHDGKFMIQSREEKGTTVYLYLPRMSKNPQLGLRSPVKRPIPFGGFPVTLVELSDALPSKVYDTRDIDG